tara:strand:+ start:16416 stop:16742 length:327 start_codon:yes stop_codon:yes gene_type:complete
MPVQFLCTQGTKMHTIKTKPLPHSSPSKILITVITISFSAFSYAELEVLDDKVLDEQTGKAGVTIDLSYKLSIGEIAYNFSDREQNDENRDKTLTPPPPRIEYHQGKN